MNATSSSQPQAIIVTNAIGIVIAGIGVPLLVCVIAAIFKHRSKLPPAVAKQTQVIDTSILTMLTSCLLIECLLIAESAVVNAATSDIQFHPVLQAVVPALVWLWLYVWTAANVLLSLERLSIITAAKSVSTSLIVGLVMVTMAFFATLAAGIAVASINEVDWSGIFLPFTVPILYERSQQRGRPNPMVFEPLKSIFLVSLAYFPLCAILVVSAYIRAYFAIKAAMIKASRPPSIDPAFDERHSSDAFAMSPTPSSTTTLSRNAPSTSSAMNLAVLLRCFMMAAGMILFYAPTVLGAIAHLIMGDSFSERSFSWLVVAVTVLPSMDAVWSPTPDMNATSPHNLPVPAIAANWTGTVLGVLGVPACSVVMIAVHGHRAGLALEDKRRTRLLDSCILVMLSSSMLIGTLDAFENGSANFHKHPSGLAGRTVVSWFLLYTTVAANVLLAVERFNLVRTSSSSTISMVLLVVGTAGLSFCLAASGIISAFLNHMELSFQYMPFIVPVCYSSRSPWGQLIQVNPSQSTTIKWLCIAGISYFPVAILTTLTIYVKSYYKIVTVAPDSDSRSKDSSMEELVDEIDLSSSPVVLTLSPRAIFLRCFVMGAGVALLYLPTVLSMLAQLGLGPSFDEHGTAGTAIGVWGAIAPSLDALWTPAAVLWCQTGHRQALWRIARNLFHKMSR
ncbi:hypothetical protein BC830DRAFT_1166307 [Chytriomyces sp. MP71]|nr:hypothetical protein BC830DRAFT_1166307 [Chytriomyces sp. MP71]